MSYSGIKDKKSYKKKKHQQKKPLLVLIFFDSKKVRVFKLCLNTLAFFKKKRYDELRVIWNRKEIYYFLFKSLSINIAT